MPSSFKSSVLMYIVYIVIDQWPDLQQILGQAYEKLTENR